MTIALALLVALTGCNTIAPVVDQGTIGGSPEVEALRDAPIPADATFAADRVIVGFWDERPASHLEEMGVAGSRVRSWDHLRAGLYELERGTDVRSAVEALRASGRFAFVEPDYERNVLGFAEADPYRPFQWNLYSLDAESAWGYATGTGTLVAVVDTGVAAGGQDGLTQLLPGYDFVSGDTDPTDDNGHGTMVAGIIGQESMNGVGTAGLAFNASILPVKVLDADGAGSVSTVLEGIQYAMDQGADVINLSLGSSTPSYAEAEMIRAAWAAGAFVVAAAGNEAGAVSYPAAYPEAVAVAATDRADAVTSYSNQGPEIDLAAPGGDLTADLDNDGWVDGILAETLEETWGVYVGEGTSFAAPQVAAAAALLMELGATNSEARSVLVNTAMDIEDEGADEATGAGLVQPAHALGDWMEWDLTEPVISDFSLTADGSGRYTLTWTTDEPSNSLVCDASFGRCKGNPNEMVTSHSLNVRGKPGRSFVVESLDANGNLGWAGPYTF